MTERNPAVFVNDLYSWSLHGYACGVVEAVFPNAQRQFGVRLNRFPEALFFIFIETPAGLFSQ